MALLLQIADLHLGPVGPGQYVGDNKDQFVPVPERQNRLHVLRGSLHALAATLTSTNRQLDAVIVGGDVSTQYSEEGFKALPEVLAELGDQHPGDENVLVVPGNHDVAWRTAASTPERYDLFIKHVRARNYATPFLEGVDIDDAGVMVPGSTARPLLPLDGGSVIVAAMNSTNYSGSVEPLRLDADVIASIEMKAATDADIAALLQETRRLALRDAARVSPAQLIALSRAFANDASPTATRALVLHHHLLPVALNEEVKAYESLSNLGEVREFLETNRIGLVMHGHKHAAKTYLDLTHRIEEVHIGRAEFVQQQPLMVSSVANVGTSLGVGSEVARLVEVATAYPRVRRISAFSIHGLAPGSTYRDASFPRVGTTVLAPDHGPDGVHVFEGATVDDVFEQLLTIFDDERAPAAALRSVVCRVADGPSALEPPECYSSLFTEPPDAWFTEIVDWWQDPKPVLAPGRFNHGSRIFNGFGDVDQLESVTEALESDPTTTRGVVMLIDPSTDDISNTRTKLPSFCFAHFVIDRDTRRLDCFGYFRKQQMRVWWPINAAELARLQKEVLRRLRERGRDLVPGAITTISAEAIAGTHRPRVLVPWIDRVAGKDSSKLWELALDLFHPDPSADVVVTAWERVFEDWLPGDVKEPDGVPVSLTGLSVLEQAVRVLTHRHNDPDGATLAGRLCSILYANESYSEIEDLPRTDAAERDRAYDKWARQVRREYEEVMALVGSITKRRKSSPHSAATPNVTP